MVNNHKYIKSYINNGQISVYETRVVFFFENSSATQMINKNVKKVRWWLKQLMKKYVPRFLSSVNIFEIVQNVAVEQLQVVSATECTVNYATSSYPF